MKKIIILFILAGVFIVELSILVNAKNKMWEGEIEYISPDNKHILTIMSNHTNAFDAPYSIRIADYGSAANVAYDFHIYECCEEPVVEWTTDHILIKCIDQKGEKVVYEIEMEEIDYEK